MEKKLYGFDENDRLVQVNRLESPLRRKTEGKQLEGLRKGRKPVYKSKKEETW